MGVMTLTTAKLTENTLNIETLSLIGYGHQDTSLSRHGFYGNLPGRVFLVPPFIRIAKSFLQRIEEITVQLLLWNVCIPL